MKARDVTPALQASLAANERLAAKLAVERRINARGVPALVFVDHALPHDVLAIIHLGKGAPLTQYIVVSTIGFKDDVLDRAMTLARRWQREHLDDAGPAVITLHTDTRYEAISAAGRLAGVHDLQRHGAERDVAGPELLEQAAAAKPMNVPGVGMARVVELK